MFPWIPRFLGWRIMSLGFFTSWEETCEEQIISAHRFCYRYLPQSFIWCFWSLGRRKERNPILMSLSLPTSLLNQCIIHAFVTESSEPNVQKWAWGTVGLLLGTGTCSAVAAQLFVLVADAVPTLPCKMQSPPWKDLSAFCLSCFLVCRSCHRFTFVVFTSCYWKILMRWKNVSQSHSRKLPVK